MIPKSSATDNATQHRRHKFRLINGGESARTIPRTLGLTLPKAASRYAQRGLYVLPVATGKHPGSIVGKGWPRKSTSDIDDVMRLWKAHADAGIAIHTGASGLTFFDLDIDVIPEELSWLKTGIIQYSRGASAQSERGHYGFFTGNEIFISGDFKLSDGTTVGDVRSGNSVIIASPSPHIHAETKNGEYHWRTSDINRPIPKLPKEARKYLRRIGTRRSGWGSTSNGFAVEASSTKVKTALREWTDDDAPHKLDALVRWIANSEDATRNPTRDALRIAASESRIGLYPFTRAVEALREAMLASYALRGESDRFSEDEFARLVANGVGYALSRHPAEIEAETERHALVTDADVDAFWSSRPVLSDLRQFAQSRLAGPWAVLGVVLARVATAIPPHVVLPPLVGSYASLNLFVALTAGSGIGKGVGGAAAFDWLNTDPATFRATLGSGEGMAKVFAYKTRDGKTGPWVQNTLRTAVLFDAPEVDNLAALSARSASTLLPQLRSAFSGEELGFSYADPTKAVKLCAHRYRLCLTVGVQPGRARALLDDADGGTPQRFLWLPVTDPALPDCPVPAPALYDLRPWPMPDRTDDRMRRIKFQPAASDALDVAAEAGALHVLALPEHVTRQILDARRAVVRGDASADPLDGHRTQVRLKVAAALMFLDGRTDGVSDQDWDLSGVVMAVSDRTRRSVVDVLVQSADAENERRGRAEGVRSVAADSVRTNKAVERVAANIVKILKTNNGTLARTALRRKIAMRDREYFEDAESLLFDRRQVDKAPSGNSGPEGFVLRLTDAESSK